MLNLTILLCFGIIGIFARYGIDQIFANQVGMFPTATIIVNLVGSALAGIIYVVGEQQNLSAGMQAALTVGLCGGFTTFSAFTLQTFKMIDHGKIALAFAYLILTPLFGLTMVLIAVGATRKILG